MNSQMRSGSRTIRRSQNLTHPLGLLLVGVFAIALLMVAHAQPLFASDFRGGDTITIGEGEVIDDDLFISGDRVTINGTVNGNLFASGTVVEVNGPVEGSLFIAGRTLALNSSVGGSVYAGGYAFTVGENAAIGRNLNFGGFSLTVEAGSDIDRSLYAGGYQILLNGAVANDVNVGSGALEITGSVGGDVRGTVGTADDGTPTNIPTFEGSVPAVAPGLRISDQAEIGGTLAVTVERATEEAAPPPPIYSLANAQLRWAIGEAVALLIIGLLFLYIRPSLLERAGQALQNKPMESLGVGSLVLLVALAAVPVTIALLVMLGFLGGIFTLGQLVGDLLGLGIVTLIFGIGLFIFTAGMLTKIVVAYGGGRLLLRQGASRSTVAVLALVIGLLIYIILRMLPFVGWLIGAVATIFGLGALYLAMRNRQGPLGDAAVTPQEM